MTGVVRCQSMKPGDELPCSRDQILVTEDASTQIQGRVADITLRVWWLDI